MFDKKLNGCITNSQARGFGLRLTTLLTETVVYCPPYLTSLATALNGKQIVWRCPYCTHAAVTPCLNNGNNIK